MAIDEALVDMDAIFAKEGKDYIVTAGNNPEIMAAWQRQAVADLETDIERRKINARGCVGRFR